jgi:hypothetical protein
MPTYDNLDDAFNIIPKDFDDSTEIVEVDSDLDHIESDYQYSRNQLYKLIQKGQKAIDGIIDVASSSDHPRAYEVAFQGMKHVSDINSLISKRK